MKQAPGSLELNHTAGLLPSAVSRRWRVQEAMRRTFEKFGYRPIETPALYRTEAVAPGYGNEVERLMCTLHDDSGHELALPYDLTVPLARYVAENARRLPLPFKRYQVQSVWRVLPGKPGHVREFHRCDIDIIGSTSLACDAEICRVVMDTFASIGLDRFVIRYNPTEQARAEVEKFLSYCTGLGVSESRLRLDPELASNLGYYTGLVFSVQLEGSEEPVCVGGRYTIALTKHRIDGVGVSFDLDRIVAELSRRKKERDTNVTVLVMPKPGYEKQALELLRELADSDLSAAFHFDPVPLIRQLRYAQEQHIPFAVTTGPDTGTVTIVRVATARRKTIPRGQLVEYLRGFYETERS